MTRLQSACIWQSLIVVCFLFSLNNLAANSGDWELEKRDEKKDITIYYRTLDSGHVEFKGVTHIETSLGSLAALFADAKAMPEWVYRTVEVDVLRKIGPREAIARTVNRMPFPFRQRDVIIHSVLHQDPNSLVVKIRGSAKPEYTPPSECCVRVTVGESYWEFAPRENGVVEITFQGYGEPGGLIPTRIYNWLCKMYLWQLPYDTLSKMKEVIKRLKYQQSSFSHIQEPTR